MSDTLRFFPTPYPDEWWYSVLCRYYVYNGCGQKFTAHKLCDEHMNALGRLFPNGICYEVIAKLPEGLLDVREVLLKHTLLPYYACFYPLEKKEKWLDLLASGKDISKHTYYVRQISGQKGLRYCPECFREDALRYGEPYWHREHQIPLMPLCAKHNCRLMSCDSSSGKTAASFIPLSFVQPQKDYEQEITEQEIMLTAMLIAILTHPWDAKSIEGYNRLVSALASAGYQSDEWPVLDIKRITQASLELYGTEITEQYFPQKRESKKIILWKMFAPECYALLAVLAGMTAEDLFREARTATGDEHQNNSN